MNVNTCKQDVIMRKLSTILLTTCLALPTAYAMEKDDHPAAAAAHGGAGSSAAVAPAVAPVAGVTPEIHKIIVAEVIAQTFPYYKRTEDPKVLDKRKTLVSLTEQVVLNRHVNIHDVVNILSNVDLSYAAELVKRANQFYYGSQDSSNVYDILHVLKHVSPKLPDLIKDAKPFILPDNSNAAPVLNGLAGTIPGEHRSNVIEVAMEGLGKDFSLLGQAFGCLAHFREPGEMREILEKAKKTVADAGGPEIYGYPKESREYKETYDSMIIEVLEKLRYPGEEWDGKIARYLAAARESAAMTAEYAARDAAAAAAAAGSSAH
jgi:hypothetical protein